MKSMGFLLTMIFLFVAPLEGAQIRCAILINSEPYSYEENGEFKGLSLDIIKEIEKRMNIEFSIEAYPFKRILNYLKSGAIDINYGTYFKKDRETFLLFTKYPIMYSRSSIFVKEGNEFDYRGIQDLYGKRVGRRSGWFITKDFDTAVKNNKIRLDETSNVVQNLKKLDLGRIDAYIGTYLTTMYHIDKMGLKGKIVALPKDVKEKQKIYITISKKAKNIRDKAEFANRLNQVIKEIHEDGTYDKLYERYINPLSQPPQGR